MVLRLAPPSRRLGGELTSAGTHHQRRSPGVLRVAAVAAQRHHLRRLHRFLYHRQRDAIAAARIQAAQSPENLGRFKEPIVPRNGLAHLCESQGWDHEWGWLEGIRLAGAQVLIDEPGHGVRDDAGEVERELERAAPVPPISEIRER